MTLRTRSSRSRTTSSPRSTPPGPFASTAENWSSSRSTAPTVRRSPGLFGCRIQPRVRTPMPVWNPDLPTTEDFRSQWEQIPDNAEFTNGFRAQWEQFLSDVDAGRPHVYDLRCRRTRPAACRCRPEILRRGSPGRDRGGSHRDHDHRHGCSAGSRRRLARDRSSRAAGRGPSIRSRSQSRIAFAAAHVVADPRGENVPGAPAARRLGSHPGVSGGTCSATGSASPRPWTPRSATWAWTGRPLRS